MILENLPHSDTLESIALNAIVIDDDFSQEILSSLVPEDFYENKNKDIFNACSECFRELNKIDLVKVCTLVTQEWSKGSGIFYLYDVCTGHNLPYHASSTIYQELRKLHILRKMKELKLDAHTVEENIVTMEKEREKYFGLMPSKNKDIATAIEETIGKTITLIPTGFENIDRLVRISPQQVVVIGARTGKGKSTILANMACNMASDGRKILYCSLEMSPEQNTRRFLRYMLGKTEWSEEEARGIGNLLPTIVFGEKCQRISDIESRAAGKAFDVIVVDYLQLLRGDFDHYSSRVQELEEITRRMKLLAEREDCIVLTAAQLNREIDKTERMPLLSDLRGCGSIEQDADIVLLLHSDDDDGNEAKAGVSRTVTFLEGRKNEVTMLVAKNREGKTGRCTFIFKKEINTFVSS